MDGRDAEDIFMEIRRTEPGQDDFFNIVKRSALLIQETPENTVSRGARVIRVNLKRTKQSACSSSAAALVLELPMSIPRDNFICLSPL